MIPILLIQKIVQLFVVLFLGFLFVKLKLVKADDSTVLSKFSLFLLMPSAILNSFAIEMTDEVMRGLLLTFGAAIVVHLVLLLIDFIYHRFFHAQAVARASVMYSNAANLIIPIVSFVLGDEWVIYSCAYLSVQILFLWTHGVRMFSREEKFNLRKILLNVNIIAVVIGIFLLISGLQLPKMATDIIGSLGSMVGNVGMLICGMVAAKIDFRKILTN